MGAGLGLALGLAVASDDYLFEAGTGEVLLTTGGGAVAGALLGAGVGALIRGWRTIYPAPERRP